MNFTYLSSVITVLLLFVFVGIVYWAFSRGNKARFDALGKLPLDEESPKTCCAEIESIRK